MTGMENRSLAIFTDYFFGTFMQHYKLYQYIFTTERDQSHFVSHITIETPLPPMALGDGQPPVLHEYESKLKKIQERRKEVKEIDPAAVKPVVEPVDVESCSQTEVGSKLRERELLLVSEYMICYLCSGSFKAILQYLRNGFSETQLSWQDISSDSFNILLQ